MSTMFATQINEVDRQTNQSFAGKSVETAGPLAMAPEMPLLGQPVYDDFSASNPFAQSTVDYSMYSESPVATTVSPSSYAIAMSSFASTAGGSFTGDVGGFTSGISSVSPEVFPEAEDSPVVHPQAGSLLPAELCEMKK